MKEFIIFISIIVGMVFVYFILSVISRDIETTQLREDFEYCLSQELGREFCYNKHIR